MGETFSTIPGDLITEPFNKESKGTAGPHQSGYLSHHNTVNNSIVISHIHSKLRMIQREKLRFMHIPSMKKRMHQKHVENLKSELKDYNVDPFEDSSAICISKGQEINFSVLQDLLQASELGNEKYIFEGKVV